ncbi:hypothetical protein KGY77_08495 [Candidatus Bipolaricaulota bacterium]|nr:hypothetical protein [Candidatus Bipolaricaulota bacterium]
MKKILRYDEKIGARTKLDPLEDVTSWISGLRSEEVLVRTLKTKHGISRKKERLKSAKVISNYIQNALGLIEQAYSGPSTTSFLPLYYAILNLSKVYIVATGKRTELMKKQNRYHGASYDPGGKKSTDISNEIVTLKSNGVLKLFYETLTGEKWHFDGRKVKLEDMYSRIPYIEAEYEQAYRSPAAFQGIELKMEETESNKYRLKANLEAESSGGIEHPHLFDKSYLKILKGFTQKDNEEKVFVSSTVQASTESEARKKLLKEIRRSLLITIPRTFGGPYTRTVISNKHMLLPEEIPIWIALFHLSNVVRYNPEFLLEAKDSKAWPMLLALHKHGIYRFLVLFLSYFNQSNYILIGG